MSNSETLQNYYVMDLLCQRIMAFKLLRAQETRKKKAILDDFCPIPGLSRSLEFIHTWYVTSLLMNHWCEEVLAVIRLVFMDETQFLDPKSCLNKRCSDSNYYLL